MGLALTELHKLPGYKEAPRIWRNGVRVLDPDWVERAIVRLNYNVAYAPDALDQWFKLASDAAEFLVHEVNVGDTSGRRVAKPIILKIAALHEVTYEDIIGASRVRVIVDARYHAIHEVARMCLHLSIAEIGRRFGDRDHTTIMYALDVWPPRAKELGIVCKPSLRTREMGRKTRTRYQPMRHSVLEVT